MSSLGADLAFDLGGDHVSLALDQFSDSFPGTALATAWVAVNPPVVGGGVVTFTMPPNSAATVTPPGPAIIDMSLVVDSRDFYLQFKLVSLTLTTSGGQIGSFGIGILQVNPPTIVYTPIIDFGGTTAGLPNTYFSPARGSNEIGATWSIAGLPAASFLVRIIRSDTVIHSEYSLDSGATWVAWDVVNPQRTVIRRDDVFALQNLAFITRTSHTQDGAGVVAVIDDVYFTSWDRYSNPLTVGNLYARSWPEGGRIDLSWTNSPAGTDEPRSLTIVRSQLAPPELMPPDTVDEAVPMLDVDCTTPSPMWLPFNSAEWSTRYPSVPVPKAYWRLAAEPGTVVATLPATIGTAQLVPDPTNLVNIAYGSTVGVNLGDMRRYAAPELIDTGSLSPFYASNVATLLNPSLFNSCAVFVVFRVARFAGAIRSILSNIDAGFTAGFELFLTAGGGLTWSVRGATTASQSAGSATYIDGAWHAALAVIDWTTGNQALWTDLDGFATGSPMPAIPALAGSVLRVGASPVNVGAHVQVLTVAAWEGAASISVRAAAAAQLFTHGRLPFVLPANVTAAYARTGIAAGRWSWVENDIPDEQVAKFGFFGGGSQPWFKRNIRYTHQSQLEMAFDAAATNKVVDSETSAGLTATSATKADLVGESPAGLRTAVSVTQTALDGRVFFSAATLTTGVQHWVTVYIRSKSSGHKVTIWVRDGADSTANINTKIIVYAQTYWKRFTVAVATSGGTTSIGVRVYGGLDGVDTNKVIEVWGRAIYESTSPYAPDYIPTITGVAALGARGAAIVTVSGVTNGLLYSAARGEVRSQFSRYANSIGTFGAVLSAQRSGGATNDSRALSVNNADRVVLAITDDTVPTTSNLTSSIMAPATEPLEARGDWWDTQALTGAGASHAKLFVNATDTVAGMAAFVSGAGVDQMFIGANSAVGNAPLRGGVAFVRFYASNPGTDGSVIPYNVGLDPLGKVIYSGGPLGVVGGAASFSDTGLTEGAFYYYALFQSRVPSGAATFSTPMTSWTRLVLGPGETDVGPVSPVVNRIGGLSLIDRVLRDGKRFYNEFPLIYRVADAEDKKSQGRVTGLLDDLATFMQRGVDQAHTFILGMRSVLDPDVGPLGLIGTPQNQTSIADAFLRQFSVNPDAAGLLGTARRRLWGGVVSVLKRKGTVGAVQDYVELITGWSAIVITQPSIDFASRFLRTWDGETSLQAILSPSTGVVFAPGSFTIASLALVPSRFQGGIYIDWFGNLKIVADNTATTVTFEDTTFTPVAERTFTATVTGGNNAQLVGAVNDDQYNFGFIHETGLGAAVAITDTLNSTRSIVTAGGLTNGAGQAVAVAAAYTGTFAARVPRFTAWLWNGDHSALYDPGADLALRGTVNDPFFTTWPGLAPTGSGASFPVTDDDVIVWAPFGAARAANRQVLWLSTDGTRVIISGNAPDVRPGDYVNPNRNQPQWFRITDAVALGSTTSLTVTLIDGVLSLIDVAALYDLATVIPRQTLEHDRAVRSMVPDILPVNGRVFVYFQE